tara:strand:- start:73 stop:816 length:744 start_codon:yes stop_codon:yes gene_type:complete
MIKEFSLLPIAYQNPNFALGNFIMITPAIKKLAETLGKPVDVVFTIDYVKQCFLDCPFINHIPAPKPHNKIVIDSNMVNSAMPDYQYSFQKVHNILWTKEYHTYVDSPQEYDYSDQDYLLVLNGLAGTGWKGKKEIPKYAHDIIKQYSKLPIWFTGSQTDLDVNSPWMGGMADRIELNNIRKALAIVRDANLIIANDTGLAHAAGALNKNVLILWKDTPFIKNNNPGKNTQYALKGEWEEKIVNYLK